jgi:hypothetical protein
LEIVRFTSPEGIAAGAELNFPGVGRARIDDETAHWLFGFLGLGVNIFLAKSCHVVTKNRPGKFATQGGLYKAL